MNLWNIEADFIGKLDTKPRAATDNEVKAYMQWQRERRGLPDLGAPDLHWSEAHSRRLRGAQQSHCIGATFGELVQHRREIARPRWEGETYFPGEYQPEIWENGAYSLLMPGHDAHRATVTMETLDDAGEVVAVSTMPIEPKKGGVVWSRESVREAAGKVTKVKRVASRAAEPVQHEGEARTVRSTGEGVEALTDAPSGSGDISDIIGKLPAPDPLAELAARMAAMEAELASLKASHPLPAQVGTSGFSASNEDAKAEATPTVRSRTPAHERAIRRAWAERKARRKAEIHLRFGQMQYDGVVASRDDYKRIALQHETAWIAATNREYATRKKRRRAVKRAWSYRTYIREQRELIERTGRKYVREHIKRRRLVPLARDLQIRHREAVAMAYRQRDARNDADDRAKGLQYDLNRALYRESELQRDVARVSDAASRLHVERGEAERQATFERQRADTLHAQLQLARQDRTERHKAELRGGSARLALVA